MEGPNKSGGGGVSDHVVVSVFILVPLNSKERSMLLFIAELLIILVLIGMILVTIKEMICERIILKLGASDSF